jgi:hypothetical protein
MMIEQNGTTKGLIDTMYKYTKQLRWKSLQAQA